jgi:DNA-binding beta-propeller fold protein YncE
VKALAVVLSFLFVFATGNEAVAQDYVYSHSIGSTGSGPGQFLVPYDVEAVGNELFVADSHNNRVHVVDLDGNFLRMWGSTGTADGQFRRNRGLTVDKRAGGRWVYVADAKNDRIQRFALDGTHDVSFGSIGQAADQFFRPRGASVAPDGTLVICDADNNRLKIYRANLSLQRIVGGIGSVDGFFRSPVDVATDSQGRIYVADGFNARVQVFSARGDYLFNFGAYGTGDGEFVVPKAITVAPDGRVFVADTSDSKFTSDRVQIFQSDGTFVQSLGSSGRGPGQFNFVAGLALDDLGRLYAADSKNDRVSVWTPKTVAARRTTMSDLKARY